MTPRLDWLRVTVWGALFVAAGLLLLGACGWLLLALEHAIARYGPWVLAHADAIAAVVLTVCAIALAVLAVAERAKKDNPSW